MALIALVISLLSMLALAAQSEAKPWCGVRCLNKRMGALSLRVSFLETQNEALRVKNSELQRSTATAIGRLDGFLGCLAQTPVSRYGESEGVYGYQFLAKSKDGVELRSAPALDTTHFGDTVGLWVFYNRCEPSEVLTPLGD